MLQAMFEEIMGVLEDIQSDLIAPDYKLGEILLTLRLVAAKLGSNDLETWVKFESEGYPNDVEVPKYRRLGMSVLGTFSGPFQSGIKNAPIPPAYIEAFIGKGASVYMLRSSAGSVAAMARQDEGIQLDLSNWMIRLRGKVYPNYEPNQIKGCISQHALIEASNAIRSRLLELTIQLERTMPGLNQLSLKSIERHPEVTDRVVHQTVYGTVNTNYGHHSPISSTTQIVQGNLASLRQAFKDTGLSERDAADISDIITRDKPQKDGWSAKTRAWLANRIANGTDEGVKGGIAALSSVIQEAALRYWNLK